MTGFEHKGAMLTWLRFAVPLGSPLIESATSCRGVDSVKRDQDLGRFLVPALRGN
jgi:hypothetical protein